MKRLRLGWKAIPQKKLGGVGCNSEVAYSPIYRLPPRGFRGGEGGLSLIFARLAYRIAFAHGIIAMKWGHRFDLCWGVGNWLYSVSGDGIGRQRLTLKSKLIFQFYL